MNKKLLSVSAVLVAVIVAAGVWWAISGQRVAARELVLHGNIDIRQVELAFNATGRVEQMLVHEADRVTKGQLLARLDTTRLQLALAQAEALADAQRSQASKLKAGSRPEEIRQVAAERDAARATANNAQQIYRRQLDLVAKHFVSQQQADSAKNTFDAAQQQLKAAEEAYRLVILGPRKEDVATAKANAAAQDAAVIALRHDIAEGELHAPDGGIIQNRILEPGDMASPQKSVYTLALIDPVWARIYLPETALGRIKPGAKASIGTDSHPDRKYAGWVGYVSPTAEFSPRSVETAELRTSLVYQARVFACEGQDELRQGMPVTVTIVYDQPASTTLPCPGGK